DKLLWACDVNFVRGEDSFVRAQWAGRPFVWHIYPQKADAHRQKLAAFIKRYGVSLPGAVRPVVGGLFEAWNGAGDTPGAWARAEAAIDAWAEGTRDWARALATHRDLATQLAENAENQL